MGIDYRKLVGKFVLGRVVEAHDEKLQAQVLLEKELVPVPFSGETMFTARPLPAEKEHSETMTGRQTPFEMLDFRTKELLAQWHLWDEEADREPINSYEKELNPYEIAELHFMNAIGYHKATEREIGYYKPKEKERFEFVETPTEMGVIAYELERMLKL